MLELPFKLFPPALLAGATLYAAVVILWLQPVIESRMAEKTLIPACEVSLDQLENAAISKPDQNVNDVEFLLRLLESTGLGDLPVLQEPLDLAGRHLERMKTGPARMSGIARNSLCGCAVDSAFAEIRWPMALHVASLRTHEPQQVRNIDHSITSIAISGACGALPWQQG